MRDVLVVFIKIFHETTSCNSRLYYVSITQRDIKTLSLLSKIGDWTFNFNPNQFPLEKSKE
jgi:hypothetical protein